MELKIQKNNGEQVESSTISVSDEVFLCDYKEPLIHQVVVTYLSSVRQGSKAQKNRSDVRGGGIKPWKQKGTGRARAGTRSSPIWRSGGVTFAARPRDFSKKINKKMYKVAVRSILSELVRNDRVVVVDSLDIDLPKTKSLLRFFDKNGLDGSLLIISSEVNENLYLSARNIPNVGISEAHLVDPVALISYKKILITESAIRVLEERLK